MFSRDDLECKCLWLAIHRSAADGSAWRRRCGIILRQVSIVIVVPLGERLRWKEGFGPARLACAGGGLLAALPA